MRFWQAGSFLAFIFRPGVPLDEDTKAARRKSCGVLIRFASAVPSAMAPHMPRLAEHFAALWGARHISLDELRLLFEALVASTNGSGSCSSQHAFASQLLDPFMADWESPDMRNSMDTFCMCRAAALSLITLLASSSTAAIVWGDPRGLIECLDLPTVVGEVRSAEAREALQQQRSRFSALCDISWSVMRRFKIPETEEARNAGGYGPFVEEGLQFRTRYPYSEHLNQIMPYVFSICRNIHALWNPAFQLVPPAAAQVLSISKFESAGMTSSLNQKPPEGRGSFAQSSWSAERASCWLSHVRQTWWG